MKSRISTLVFLFLMLFFAGCQKQEVKNTQAYLGIKEGGKWFWVTKDSGKEQYEYRGGEFKPLTELTVDEKHTDHSFDIQFEGPGWESDKIGYRLYLDWRNAIDIFGKKTDKMVLQQVGLDGFDSYHEMQDWGVDVLQVGDALGIGSLAYWNGTKAVRVEKTSGIHCKVESGNSVSKVYVDYSNWEIDSFKTNVSTILEIEAGSYLTKYSINLSNELPNLATGIVKLKNSEMKIISDLKPGWSCMLTFGKQSLQNDMLGMCIFFKTDELLEQTEDINSHVIVLKPENNQLTYYFGAAWQQDASGVKSMDDFINLLKSQVNFIN